jgi:hypothetical protein
MIKISSKLLITTVVLFFCISECVLAQSFSTDNTSAVNFIKRLYSTSPFEGVKKIEADDRNYFVIAISLINVSNDSALSVVPKLLVKAHLLAEQGFAEPCVKFEMVERHVKGNQSTYLFLCTTLDDFFTSILTKKNVDGAKIISAPNNNFVVASISLENSKYSTSEMRDKIAFMKAKQMVNTLINGSTITSVQIIRTDETDTKTEITITDIVKEHTMGFIPGIELLFSREIEPNKTTYVYYLKF